jgi:uncharacterized protein YfkK (UPF0435 family)
MDNLKKIYYDLTGTPYFKVQLMAHNHILDTLNFTPDERIVTKYGEFQSPKDCHKVYNDNKIWIMYDIEDFKPLKMVKKSVYDKIKEKILKHNDISIIYDKNDENYEKQTDNEPLTYIHEKINPREYMALHEAQTIIDMSKPEKGNNIFTGNNMLYLILICIGGFIAYKYMTTGKLL